MARAAIGLSVHTGWAALVAVAGPTDAPAVADRRRLEMIADGSRFAYHRARDLPLREAERSVRAAVDGARSRARQELDEFVRESRERGHEIVAAGILGAPPSSPASLARILESHAAIHRAEGELFRSAIGAACAELSIATVYVATRDLHARGATALGIPAARLPERLDAIRRAVGRPWAKDQKDAFLAALLAAPPR